MSELKTRRCPVCGNMFSVNNREEYFSKEIDNEIEEGK